MREEKQLPPPQKKNHSKTEWGIRAHFNTYFQHVRFNMPMYSIHNLHDNETKTRKKRKKKKKKKKEKKII